MNARPLKVFYSYAHEDEALRAKLVGALAPLRREGLIEDWHDRDIRAGAPWAEEIDQKIDSADLILLLVSRDFLASDYVNDVEMRRALARDEAGTATVVPIILRDADWSSAPFAKLQALPKDAKPITLWDDEDAAFADVARGIRKVVLARLGPQTEFGGLPAPTPVLRPKSEEPSPRARVLDAAIPSHIVIGRSTELQMLVRLPDSPGLKGILALDEGSDAQPEDVQSKPFKMTFPVGPAGKPEPRLATVTVQAPDFDPPTQSKRFEVPPDSDSEQLSFLMQPVRQGRLAILVELSWQEAVRGGRSLRTECVAEAGLLPAKLGTHLIQVPIQVGVEGTPSALQENPSKPEEPSTTPIEAKSTGASQSGGVAEGVVANASKMPASSLPYAALGTLGLVASVGVGLWAPWKTKPDTVNACIETVFREKHIASTPRKVTLSVDAVKTGKLDLTADDGETSEYRKNLSDPVLIAALNICHERARPTNAPLSIKAAAQVNVAVRRGDQEHPQAQVLVGALNQGVRPCTTDDRGQCTLFADGLDANDKVVLTTLFDGTNREHPVAVSQLLTGATKLFVMPKLPELVLTLTDCDGKTRQSGKVRFDGNGVFNTTCRDFDDASCREALLDHGEARFRYDPALATNLTLNFYPDSGALEAFPIPKLHGDLQLRYQERKCIASLATQRCQPGLEAAIRNEARGADGSFRGSFSFSVKSHTLSIRGGSDAIRRQLSGKPSASQDCTSALSLL